MTPLHLATDVHYDDHGARVAGVGFVGWGQAVPDGRWSVHLTEVADYVPGSFYRRELPCLLALLDRVDAPLASVVVDGNVWNAPGVPGLGAHLYAALDERIPVVGVAKSRLRGVEATEVLRGTSKRPLLVTAVGMSRADAVAAVRSMHGAYRIPTLLKEVDHLARATSPSSPDRP